jgi:hypothetical protein
MTALTITPFEDANWEINDAWQDHPPSANHSLSDGFLSNKQIQREKKILPELGKKFIAPKIVDLALGFKILHNKVPGGSVPLWNPLGSKTSIPPYDVDARTRTQEEETMAKLGINADQLGGDI